VRRRLLCRGRGRLCRFAEFPVQRIHCAVDPLCCKIYAFLHAFLRDAGLVQPLHHFAAHLL